MRISKKYEKDKDLMAQDLSCINEIIELIKLLPESHKVCLEILLKHLQIISQNCEENKMTPSNLGVVFGPTLFRPPKKSFSLIPASGIEASQGNNSHSTTANTSQNKFNNLIQKSPTLDAAFKILKNKDKDKSDKDKDRDKDKHHHPMLDETDDLEDTYNQSNPNLYSNKLNSNMSHNFLSASSILDEIRDMPDQARLIELLIINRDYISNKCLSEVNGSDNVTAVLTRV